MSDTPPPRIGDPAPDFTAPSSQGDFRFSTRIEGRWAVLLAMPAAFTPVSVTEILELARLAESFKAAGAELVVLTPDTRQALLAWQRDLKQRFGVESPAVLVSDTGLKTARAWGFIHPGASATCPVRASVIVDPKGTVRALQFHPLANGRSIAALLTLLEALQASDEHQCATPADWSSESGRLLAAPPTRFDEVELDGHGDKEDFYLRWKS